MDQGTTNLMNGRYKQSMACCKKLHANFVEKLYNFD